MELFGTNKKNYHASLDIPRVFWVATWSTADCRIDIQKVLRDLIGEGPAPIRDLDPRNRKFERKSDFTLPEILVDFYIILLGFFSAKFEENDPRSDDFHSVFLSSSEVEK